MYVCKVVNIISYILYKLFWHLEFRCGTDYMDGPDVLFLPPFWIVRAWVGEVTKRLGHAQAYDFLEGWNTMARGT